MFIYIFLLVTLITAGGIANIFPKYKKVIYLFIVSLLTIIAAFRYETGMDYETYETIYINIRNGWAENIEIGFSTLCRFCIALGGTPQLMFAIMAIATIPLLYCAYKRYSPNIIMTLWVFLCFGQMYLNTFNVIRQCFAVALFLYSIQYITLKKPIKYLALICLASTFHTTAILLAPLYWILNRNWGKLVLLSVLVTLILSTRIIINIIYNSPYAIYLAFENYTQDASAINYLYLVISCNIFIFSDKLMKNYNDRQIFLNLNFLALLMFSLYITFSGTPLVMVITRLTYYFIFFYAITFTRILHDLKNSNARLCALIATSVFLVIIYLRTTVLLGHQYHLTPYQFNLNLF